MTETQQIQRKHKILYKITSIGIVTLVQSVGFLMMSSVLLYFFPLFHSDLGMEISLYLCSYLVFPISSLAGNVVAMFAGKEFTCLFAQ